MAIKLGVIEYERPAEPVTADDIRQLLAVGGKDVVRLAWQSLNPGESGKIHGTALQEWLIEFFNLYNVAEANEIIHDFATKDLIEMDGKGWLRPLINV